MTSASTSSAERIARLIEALDIPESYYEKAINRATSIRGWLVRPASTVKSFEPVVCPQGSFRLGTVIRPVLDSDEYDLDLVCQMMSLTKQNVTQKQLKHFLGDELAGYREAQNIKNPLTECKRCWRIDYADEVCFHIDCLPCVPEDETTIAELLRLRVPPAWAATAIALTYTKHERYAQICTDWLSSNPVGFATWFETRFGPAAENTRIHLLLNHKFTTPEEIPAYALKTPLQRVIQLLKRHRDVMFQRDQDLKPISMIITTLSALAYCYETNVWDAVIGVLRRMPEHVRGTRPRIPNPVNPLEDFADKWSGDPRLEDNFWLWHAQALRDFEALTKTEDPDEFAALTQKRLDVFLSKDNTRPAPLILPPSRSSSAPRIRVEGSPRPWGGDRS
jgi:hypothetical protein